MATFAVLPIEEAQRMSLPPRRAIAEQYRKYIRSLEEDSDDGEVAGRLELGEEDRPITERARLKAAARAEGLALHIQRRGNAIMFWSEGEAPPVVPRGARKPTPARNGQTKMQATKAKSAKGKGGRPKGKGSR